MGLAEELVLWISVHGVILVLNFELYHFDVIARPMNVLLPVLWVISLLASSIAISLASSHSSIEAETFFLQFFCVLYLAVFTVANRLHFHYKRQKLGLILTVSAGVWVALTEILAGVTDEWAGVIYLPTALVHLLIQLPYCFCVFRRSLTPAEVPESKSVL